jgi:dihydroneopterin aldolase
MDKIIIEDLQVYAHHGVAQEEKAIGQMFIISVEIGVDLDLAAKTDRLDATISYAEVCDEIQKVLQSKTYSLIEAAALQVVTHLFNTYPRIEEIKVRLKKPWAPMGHHLKYAAVELQRKRENKHDWL